MDRARRKRGLQIKRRTNQQPIFVFHRIHSSPANHKTWLLNPHNQPTARSVTCLNIIHHHHHHHHHQRYQYYHKHYRHNQVTCLTSIPPSPSPPTPSPLLRTPSPPSPSPSTSPPSPCPAYSALEVTDQHITEKQKWSMIWGLEKNTYWCLMHFERVWFWTYKERDPSQGEISSVRATGHMVTTSKGTKTKAYNRIINSSFNWACTKPITNKIWISKSHSATSIATLSRSFSFNTTSTCPVCLSICQIIKAEIHMILILNLIRIDTHTLNKVGCFCHCIVHSPQSKKYIGYCSKIWWLFWNVLGWISMDLTKVFSFSRVWRQ